MFLLCFGLSERFFVILFHLMVCLTWPLETPAPDPCNIDATAQILVQMHFNI